MLPARVSPRHKLRWRWFAALLGCAIPVSGHAAAQTLSEQQAASAAPAADEIIVTAQRRRESIQDVPAAVTAVSGTQIERSTFRNLTDIQYLAPSVQINSGLTYPTFNIRGVGTQTFDTGAEASVGLVIDNVIEANMRSLGINNLVDIDRVEVLRGPQGTLFGKNSSAGVIQVVTNDPKFNEFEAIGRLNYGSQNELVTNLTLNVPIAENLAGRLTGYYQQRDGFITDLTNGRLLGGSEDYGFRGRLRWEPTDGLRIDAIGYAAWNANTIGRSTLRSFGSRTLAQTAPLGIQAGPGNLSSLTIGEKYWQAANHGGSLEATLDLPAEHTLTAITGWRRWRLESSFPRGEVPTPIADINLGRDYESNQFTQELRIASRPSRFSYQLGFYYFHFDLYASQLQGGTFGLVLPPGLRLSPIGGDAIFTNRNISTALFGDTTFAVSDQLRVIAGARYTWDDVQAGLRVLPVAGFLPLGLVPPDFSGGAREQDLSWRLGAQYDFTSDIMAYATASRGYKGPVIASVFGVINQVDPERVMAYELGLKSVLFDRRLILNLALFHSKFRDFQATIVDTDRPIPAAVLANAEQLVTRGIEADFSVRPTASLSFNGNLALNDTSYGTILVGCYPLQPQTSNPRTGCGPVPGSATLRATSLEGLQLAMSPRWTFSIGTDYQRNLSPSLVLDTNVRYSWRSEVRSNAADPNTLISAYGLLNANIGIADTNGRWRIGAYARNLLNQRFVALIDASFLDPGGYLQTPSQDAMRTLGITLEARY